MTNDVVQYKDHNEIYQGAEILIEKEDMMDINEPVIQQKLKKSLFVINNKVQPNVVEYLKTDRLRNVAICGNLHSGKTSLVDYLLSTTHADVERFTDNHILEVEKRVSIMTTPISIQLGSTKTMQFNLLDLPGHSGTIYEFQNLQMTDGCCVVIDIVEGLSMTSKTSIEYSLKYNIPFVVVFNKIDRLIVELKLPPKDAYQKMNVVINDINRYIIQFGGTRDHKIHPLNNNVVFSSFSHGWCFSLESFATLYLQKSKYKMTVQQLTSKLWGNYAFKNYEFVPSNDPTSFVDFILEPLYKIYGIILGDPIDHVKAFVAEMRIRLPKTVYKQSPTTIVKAILQQWLGDPQPVINLISSLPSPNNVNMLQYYPFNNTLLSNAIQMMDPTGSTIIQISRIYYYEHQLMGLGRILSGTLLKGDKLRHGKNDIEAFNALFRPFSKSLIPTSKASVGEFVLIPVSENIRPHTLLVDVSYKGDIEQFTPYFIKDPKWLYIAIEPRLPSNLPMLLKQVIIITRIYPGIEFKVQDSGEYGLFSSNEFIMDCVLHDLRFLCQFDVRVSDPIAKLRETVMESSQIQSTFISPNLKNVITTIAEPMEASLMTKLHCDKKSVELSKYWDELAVASLWAFGPDDYSTCALLNDVVDDTRDIVESLKDPLVKGFNWACKAGPLCDDLLYGVKFKIINATSDNDVLQIPPTMRKSLFNSMLSASPRFVEPMLYYDVICPQECFGAISKLLNSRRGNILTSFGIACTPLFCLKCQIPALDSFGAEVDIRMITQGQAMVYGQFSHYQLLESDPLLRLFEPIVIEHLEPSPVQLLATDYLLKTRRRKGLGDDIVIDDSLKMLFNL